MKRISPSDPRVKQVLVGIAAIFAICVLIGLIYYAGTLPGFIGECFAMITGIITTPFLMEGSFIIIGLLTVMFINNWRLRREGDELVYLEEAEGPGSESLPDSAKWAIYKDQPLDPECPDLLAQVEGALEIGDHETAIEALASMKDSDRDSPAALKLRIKLARDTGKSDLLEQLKAKLAASDH
ncbi:hypothetical protein [Haloferula sp.]|uniref:hypothetical protein n=1 Tax=Haloferula sp. TaxID=2497595 RepID=UPI00329B9B43